MMGEPAGSVAGEERCQIIKRLAALLSTRFLREYLTAEVEGLVAACEDSKSKRRVDDAHLPELLLDLHGTEILRNREVRAEILSKLSEVLVKKLLDCVVDDTAPRGKRDALKKIASRKWTPGKRWALQFCSILDIPISLAGQQDGSALPALENLEPYLPLPPLHDFQAELRDRLLKLMENPASGPRGLLSLPTGAGKTRTCVEALILGLRNGTIRDGHVLWIAQSEELCEQAVQAFHEVWRQQTVAAANSGFPDGPEATLPLVRLWGSRSLPEDLPRGIFVASIQKLTRMTTAGGAAIFSEFFERVRVVIVDEAHHAIAKSYTELFAQLGFTSRGGDRVMLGLTATPYRGSDEETKRLVRRFASNLLVPKWDNAVEVLRERKILASTEILRIETKRKFLLEAKEREWFNQFSELPEKTLRRIGNDIDRNKTILQTLLGIDEGSPVLFFGCSVSHARAIALLLRRQGRSAAAVTAETPLCLRRLWIQQFKDGDVQFLCNYGILTTGFDAPKVEVVVIGRPTSSVLVYEQMLGRGMRGPMNGGTETCRIVDLVDIFPQFGEQMSYQRYQTMWQISSQKLSAIQAPHQSAGGS